LQPVHEEFQREVAAFERLLPELLQDYQGRVVAIRGGQVIEVGDSKAEVSERVHEHLGDVTVYVQQVEEQPRVHRFPYFRVVR
jgi:ABC-type enterochelin transport system ATPase subunit